MPARRTGERAGARSCPRSELRSWLTRRSLSLACRLQRELSLHVPALRLTPGQPRRCADERTACVPQMEESLLNDIIDRLLDVRNGRPGKQVQLTEAEIKQLCMTAKEIFMGQPNLLELEAPIKICGQCSPQPACLAPSPRLP